MPAATPDHSDAQDRLLPPGKTTFDLPMGKLRVRVVDLPTSWHPFVEETYAPFAEQPSGRAPDLTVRCRTGSGVVIPLPGPGQLPIIDVTELAAGRYRIRSHWQEGEVDVGAGEGELTLTSREPVPMRMSLENFLRISCQLALTDRGAFLLHSAGVLDEGRCFLFFGQSGAGKSTATELSAPRSVLSDDMVLVDAASNPVQIHAVPFFGLFPPEQRTRGAFPAAAAFRLRQSDEVRIESLSGARAVATVSASVPFVHDLGLRHDGITDLVTRFCERVTVADLHFTRSARFWDLLRKRHPA